MDTLVAIASFAAILAALRGHRRHRRRGHPRRVPRGPAPQQPHARIRGTARLSMMSWTTFAEADPELASAGRRLLERIGERLGAAGHGPRRRPAADQPGDRRDRRGPPAGVRDRRLGEGPRPARRRPVRAARPPGPRESRTSSRSRGRAVEVADASRPRARRRRRGRSRSTTATGCSSSASSTPCSASEPAPTTGRRSTAPGAPGADPPLRTPRPGARPRRRGGGRRRPRGRRAAAGGRSGGRSAGGRPGTTRRSAGSRSPPTAEP